MSVKNFSNTVDAEKLGIPKIEAEIADLSSKVLPDVTSADEGKTIVVNSEGNWELGNVDSDKYIIVKATFNKSSSRLTVTNFEKWSKVKEEIEITGKEAIIEVKDGNYVNYVPLIKENDSYSTCILSFSSDKKYLYEVIFNNIPNTAYASGTYSKTCVFVPPSTSSDNGKLLQVVSGSATWVDLDGNNEQF